MNLSAIAIKRPVFVVVLTLGLLVLGAKSFFLLGTDLFPDVTFPIVTISIPYPGAGPNEVENLITKQIEDSVISLNGIDRVRTWSEEGLSRTLVMFKLGVDIAEAATQVRERVAQVRWKLPPEHKEPILGRFDASAMPVLIYTVSGPRSLSEVRKFADDIIKPQLEQIDGVASVDVKGGSKREVKVEIDRSRLDALGLDLATVVMRLRAANLTVPAGRLDEPAREISVRTVGEFVTVESIRDVVVATNQDGSLVHLRDIAAVEDGYEDVRTIVRSNGQEAVSFAVLKQSGSNSVAVSDKARAQLKAMLATLPPEYRLNLIMDQAQFIKENAHEVETAIVFGGAMAILIILIFMLDLRSTLISAVALPTSVVGTFFIMYVLNYTLNMMTLLGLSLAIGLLIDDAVVVRENIFKHLERGKTPAQAALDGTSEIALSVLATTLTIVAVFLPVAFIKGMAGQFFRQFGFVVSSAVTLSLIVAFTLDPMLSSRFSKPVVHGAADPYERIKRPFVAFFHALDASYAGVLKWAVTHKAIVGALALASLIFTGFLMSLMGNEFVSAEDRGQFTVEIELPAGTSLEETDRVSRLAEEEYRKNPNIITVFATIGPGGAANKASWRIVAKPKLDRPGVPQTALKKWARDAVHSVIKDVKINVADPAFVEGAPSEAPIMIDVRGNDYNDIVPAAEQIVALLRRTPGIDDVQIQYTPGRPEHQVVVDRRRAADQGLAVAQIALAVRTAIEGDEAGNLRQGKDEVPIKVRFQKSDRLDPSALLSMTMPTPRGSRVRLSDVASFSRGLGPQVIEREDRNRQIAVWATPRGRALGDLLKEFGPQLEALKLPRGVTTHYDGQIRMMLENNAATGLALWLAILFIYIVLASQFESFIHPVTIMATLPLALVGAIVALFLTNNTFAIGTMIGIVLLMGLVTKNAILLIDRALVRVRDNGETPLHAILAAGPERLRPILMTSAAMVLGMLPTALNRGDGSEFRAPMAIAVIGGVISSTLLSLIVVPVLYLAIENNKARIARWFGW